MSFARELEVARAAAEAAAKVIARHCKTERRSWDKAEDSPVTLADLEANEAITSLISKSFPHDIILSEESRDSAERLTAERVWVVDPLDGTKEFIENVPEFSVSIALTFQGTPVVGVVHQPLSGESFYDSQGGGSHLAGEPLRVSSVPELARAEVLSSRTEMKRGQMEPCMALFRAVRPLGSVALKLAHISAGRGDLWISTAPKSEWDVCAGDLLVRESGGIFRTLDLGERTYNQAEVLLQPLMAAGPVCLVDEFERRIRR